MAKSALSRIDFFRCVRCVIMRFPVARRTRGAVASIERFKGENALFSPSKVPEELQIGSASGRFFSLFSFALMGFLIMSHYQSYTYMGTKSIVTLDEHQEDRLRINFNVSLLAVPCAHASVDVSDHMGQRFVNVTRHIRHFRLGSSKESSEVSRLDEIVMDDHDKGIPIWGGTDRSTHMGVHYSTPLTNDNFDDYMRKYELVLVNFYAPWCPFCQQLNPEWERAAAQLDDHPEYSERVKMASVDCTDDMATWLCRRAHIRAFPSMLIYMYGSTSTRFIYNGPRTAPHLLQFLDLFFRRLEPDADFAEEVNMNSNTLGLPMHVNYENLEGVNLKKVRPSAISSDAVEGCEISGSLSVNRVPGKLVFTARSKEHSFDFGAVNVTHRVNHFSFGQMKRSEHLVDGARKLVPSERYPLDNKIFYAENDNITIEHFMNVRLPSPNCDMEFVVGFDHEDTRKSMFDLVERIYEFSASSNQYNATNTLPAALFSFDISPLVIQVVSDYMPFYRFITSLCAVVGGVFTVIGLVDSGVFHAMNSIKKKQQLGKLS
ncbi:Thioredoxin-like protein, partial [Globisporangium splendens]